MRANNSRILRIKKAKFSGYCFCMNTNIKGDFQICIGVPLNTQMLARGMFFIKGYLQMCLYSNVYDMISLFRNKREEKHRASDTYYINNDHANVIKFTKVTSKSTQCKKRRKKKYWFP